MASLAFYPVKETAKVKKRAKGRQSSVVKWGAQIVRWTEIALMTMV